MPPATFGNGFGSAANVVVMLIITVLVLVTHVLVMVTFGDVAVVNIAVDNVDATDDMFITIASTGTQRSPASIN